MNLRKLKKDSKEILKKNFGTLVIVSIFMSFFIGEYIISNDGFNNFRIVEQMLQDNKENKVNTYFFNNNSDYIINRYVDTAIFNLISGNTVKKIDTYNLNHNVYKGIFFTIFNFLTNGQIQFQNFINSLAELTEGVSYESIMIIIGSCCAIFLKIFVLNPFLIGENRLFLENINYKETKLKRLLWAFHKGRYEPVVKTIFRVNMYKFFWDLTVVGGIIKNYSYKMVFFILAENPYISSKDAINLSKNMMNGHKFEAFKIDLSFLGWFILEYISFGIAGIYVNPYYKACFVQLYRVLREEYIEQQKINYYLLNDEILFNKKMLLKKAYDMNINKYPDETDKISSTKYQQNYSLTSLIIMFFIFAFVGWIWECLYILVDEGILSNRGALYGPWVPIYGFGCVSLLLLSNIKAFKKILKSPLKTFFTVMFLCTIMEYITSVYLEITKGVKYWDYTGIFLNIKGRICLENSIFFGIGGCICLYFVGPYLEDKIKKISKTIQIASSIILITIIMMDITYSTIKPHMGPGITEEIKNKSKIEFIYKT